MEIISGRRSARRVDHMFISDFIDFMFDFFRNELEMASEMC